MIVEAVRGYVQLVSGLGELTRARAVEAAEELLSLPAVGDAVKVAGQATLLADQILAAAQANRENLVALIRSEIDARLARLELAGAGELREAVGELQQQVMVLSQTLHEGGDARTVAATALSGAFSVGEAWRGGREDLAAAGPDVPEAHQQSVGTGRSLAARTGAPDAGDGSAAGQGARAATETAASRKRTTTRTSTTGTAASRKATATSTGTGAKTATKKAAGTRKSGAKKTATKRTTATTGAPAVQKRAKKASAAKTATTKTAATKTATKKTSAKKTAAKKTAAKKTAAKKTTTTRTTAGPARATSSRSTPKR